MGVFDTNDLWGVGLDRCGLASPADLTDPCNPTDLIDLCDPCDVAVLDAARTKPPHSSGLPHHSRGISRHAHGHSLVHALRTMLVTDRKAVAY